MQLIPKENTVHIDLIEEPVGLFEYVTDDGKPVCRYGIVTNIGYNCDGVSVGDEVMFKRDAETTFEFGGSLITSVHYSNLILKK